MAHLDCLFDLVEPGFYSSGERCHLGNVLHLYAHPKRDAVQGKLLCPLSPCGEPRRGVRGEHERVKTSLAVGLFSVGRTYHGAGKPY
jgi:hypothetical protein